MTDPASDPTPAKGLAPPATPPAASWAEVEATAPELAGAVRARFEDTGLALVATLRADGSPRISGWEPLFAAGELWLGAMPDARKSADLRRDPRLALHAATTDPEVHQGDAKVAGRAVDIADDGTKSAFVAAFEAATGQPPPAGPLDLFRVEVTEISRLRPAGDHLVIEWWRPADGAHRVERR